MLAASAAVKRDMMQHEHVRESKVTVARSGYDFAVLRPSLAAGERDRIRRQLGGVDRTLLLTVSRLSESKGHRYLIDAMPRILEAAPDALFVWAGTGPLHRALDPELENRGLAEHVAFLGWRGDVPHLMEASDLIIHPSLHEAFCSVIIESMALARPIVSTNIAAAPEQIDDGESGLLVPARDGDTLAAAAVKLQDPERARVLGDEAQRRVRERFNYTRMVPLYESIYDELFTIC